MRRGEKGEDKADCFGDSEAMLSLSDAADIGFKIVETADRVRKLNPMVPGAEGSWGFEMDGVRFDVLVKLSK